MIHIIKNLIKRIVTAFLMLYGYNIIVPAAAIIPINIITITILTILSIPGLILLIIVRMLVY